MLNFYGADCNVCDFKPWAPCGKVVTPEGLYYTNEYNDKFYGIAFKHGVVTPGFMRRVKIDFCQLMFGYSMLLCFGGDACCDSEAGKTPTMPTCLQAYGFQTLEEPYEIS